METNLTEQALHVVELRAENVKRLKAIQIVPSNNVVILGGKNEQGKTTVLDCIEWAISGAKAIQGAPVRRGQLEASIFLDLGDLRIERTFDPTGSKLTVKDASGDTKKRPQELLDKLYSKVAFRPLEFANLKPAEQLARLKQIVGLDFTEQDAKKAQLFQKRTEIGRVVDAEQIRFAAYPAALVNAPDVEVSVAALMAEKESADRSNREIENKLARARLADVKVAELQRQLDEAMTEQAEATAEAAGLAIEDTAQIVAAIKGAEDINRQVRAKIDRAASLAKLKKAEKEREDLTKEIEAVESDKAAQMKAAKWPIPGLGFSSDGVTLHGLPFDQASKAQRMKTSLAIGMEQNPRLRVLLLQDASLLDDDSMQTVRDFANDNNMQIWIERVGTGDDGAIIIEDGEIKGSTDG